MDEQETEAMWQSLSAMVDAWDRQPTHVVDRYLDQDRKDDR